MPAAFERCVKDVKAKGKASNPWAVCRASMGTDNQILARQKAKGKPKAKKEKP